MINFSSLTDPKVFCCLLLSAMKLQASTHCLISGAAWAKLLYKLAVLVTSILSTRWHSKNKTKNHNKKNMLLWGTTQDEEGDHNREELPMDRVRPCLSLCLSNIISLRGCFRTYSSALCIRPKELRRRSLMPFTSVVASLSSTSGGMHRKRGTASRNTWRKYRVLKKIEGNARSSAGGQEAPHKAGQKAL